MRFTLNKTEKERRKKNLRQEEKIRREINLKIIKVLFFEA